MIETRPWRQVLTFIGTYGPAFAIFVLPALVNRFPLVFNDTGTYLRAGIEHYNPADRPIYYSIFLYLLHWRVSLWPIVFGQAALALAVLSIFLRASLGAVPRAHLALLLALVGWLTSLPVFICQIMPDMFTPLLVIGLCSLIFHRAGLSGAERVFMALIVLAAICFHQANFLIAAATLLTAWLCQAIATRRSGPFQPFLLPSLMVVLGVTLLVLPNYLAHRTLAITRASSVFLLAKVIDDGAGFDYLSATCPTRHYSICPQLPAIQHYKETTPPAALRLDPTADFILWHGPVVNAGGWNGVLPYAGAVSIAAIKAEPGTMARASLNGFADQLTSFATGDGIKHINEASYLVSGLRLYFPAGIYRAFSDSLQQTDRLHFGGLSLFHQIVTIAGALALLALLIGAGRDTALAATALSFIAAIIANALVAGVLSSVHDRYQSRIDCLIIVAVLALGYRRLMARRQPGFTP